MMGTENDNAAMELHEKREVASSMHVVRPIKGKPQHSVAEDVLDQCRNDGVDGRVDAEREVSAIQSMLKIVQEGRGSSCCQDARSAGVDCPNLRPLKWEICKSAT